MFPVVATSKTRLKNYPDVPTLEELGIKDVGNTLWHAVWAPAATPPATMKILFDGIQKAMKGPKMLSLFEKAEMWGPELKSFEASKAWYDEAMKSFIRAANEAAPLAAKEGKN